MQTLKTISYALLFMATIFQHVVAQVGGGRDGYVVWEKIRNNQIRIWRANLDGTNAAQISGTEGAAHQGPVISTDGRRVAYAVAPTDDGSEYPAGGAWGATGPDLEIWVVNRDGSNRRKVFSGARSAGESRILRWLSATHLAVATPGGTFRVRVPESGLAEIEAGTLTGGRQTAANGLICKLSGDKWLMVSPSGRYAYCGYGGDGRVFAVDDNHTPSEIFKAGGCQSFVSTCDRYAVGSRYQARDVTVTIDPRKSGTYDGSTTDGKWYDYFPTIGNDATAGAIGKSSGQHGHRVADYDIFVFNLALQDGLIRPTGTIVNITSSSDTDRWPDIWVSTGPQGPALDLDKSSLTFLSEATETGNPSSQQVNAGNIGGGTLPSLTATPDRTWLGAAVSGDGNNQIITVSITRGDLGEGTHTGTITVSGADLTAAGIAVSYTIKGQRVATQIAITPASAVIAPRESVSFSATVLDGDGDPMEGTVTWAVDRGGFIDQLGLFTSNGDAGRVVVTATLSDNTAITGTATIDVTTIPTAGMAVWFRADAGVSAGTDGRVSNWDDQSGEGRHAAQANNAARPLLVEDGYNGQPVIRFNGTQFLDLQQVEVSPFTVFLVYRVSELTNELLQWVISASYGGENHGYHVGSQDQTGFPNFLAYDGTCMAEEAPPPVGVFRHMVSVRDALYFDGVKVPLATSIPFEYHRDNVGSLTRMAIRRIGGFFDGGTHHFNGDIAEIIFYGRELDDAQIKIVTAYLNEKYAVTPLTVISPNGAETYAPGDEIIIRWRAGDVGVVNLKYSANDGDTWIPINVGFGISIDDDTWGAYPWTVPDVSSNACLIRVEDYVEASIYDESDATFTITSDNSVGVHTRKKGAGLAVFYRSGMLHISGARPAAGAAAHVYDCRGARVASAGVRAGQTTVMLPVMEIGAGQYVVTVIDKEGTRVFPIVVMQ